MTRRHTCHWPGCTKQVPPALWGCKTHWFKLPRHFRDRVWDTYEIGQEVRMDPSEEYLAVAFAIQEWIYAQSYVGRDGREPPAEQGARGLFGGGGSVPS